MAGSLKPAFLFFRTQKGNCCSIDYSPILQQPHTINFQIDLSYNYQNINNYLLHYLLQYIRVLNFIILRKQHNL